MRARPSVYAEQLVKTEHGGTVDCFGGCVNESLIAYAESVPGLGTSRVFVQNTETGEVVATIEDGESHRVVRD